MLLPNYGIIQYFGISKRFNAMEIRYQRKGYTDVQLQELYKSIVKPRMIEEKMLLLLRQGKISKWFSGIGQEAISAAVINALNEEEYILMGMSAYGDPDKYYEEMKLLLNTNLHRGCRSWLPGVEDYYDFAASAQKIYEEEFEALVYKTKKMLPHPCNMEY